MTLARDGGGEEVDEAQHHSRVRSNARGQGGSNEPLDAVTDFLVPIGLWAQPPSRQQVGVVVAQ